MRIALLLVLLVCLVMQARYMWDFSSGQCHNRKCMNYVKVFVLNLCVSISDSMYFQIVIQGVDLSVHTLYVSLGESVLFVSPLYFGKDATTIQCVFFGGHTDFFLQYVLSVSEYIKSLIGRLIFPLYTLCSLNGNCDCDPTTDSIVHLILMPRKRLAL